MMQQFHPPEELDRYFRTWLRGYLALQSGIREDDIDLNDYPHTWSRDPTPVDFSGLGEQVMRLVENMNAEINAENALDEQPPTSPTA